MDYCPSQSELQTTLIRIKENQITWQELSCILTQLTSSISLDNDMRILEILKYFADDIQINFKGKGGKFLPETQKFILSLLRRIKRDMATIKSLLLSIITKGCCVTDCVLIGRNRDGRLQSQGGKYFPHVLSFQLWRDPGIVAKTQLQANNICKDSFYSNSGAICINPFHYDLSAERKLQLSIINHLTDGARKANNTVINKIDNANYAFNFNQTTTSSKNIVNAPDIIRVDTINEQQTQKFTQTSYPISFENQRLRQLTTDTTLNKVQPNIVSGNGHIPFIDYMEYNNKKSEGIHVEPEKIQMIFPYNKNTSIYDQKRTNNILGSKNSPAKEKLVNQTNDEGIIRNCSYNTVNGNVGDFANSIIINKMLNTNDTGLQDSSVVRRSRWNDSLRSFRECEESSEVLQNKSFLDTNEVIGRSNQVMMDKSLHKIDGYSENACLEKRNNETFFNYNITNLERKKSLETRSVDEILITPFDDKTMPKSFADHQLPDQILETLYLEESYGSDDEIIPCSGSSGNSFNTDVLSITAVIRKRKRRMKQHLIKANLRNLKYSGSTVSRRFSSTISDSIMYEAREYLNSPNTPWCRIVFKELGATSLCPYISPQGNNNVLIHTGLKTLETDTVICVGADHDEYRDKVVIEELRKLGKGFKFCCNRSGKVDIIVFSNNEIFVNGFYLNLETDADWETTIHMLPSNTQETVFSLIDFIDYADNMLMKFKKCMRQIQLMEKKKELVNNLRTEHFQSLMQSLNKMAKVRVSTTCWTGDHENDTFHEVPVAIEIEFLQAKKYISFIQKMVIFNTFCHSFDLSSCKTE